MSTKKSISHMNTVLFALIFMLSLAISTLNVTYANAAGVRYAKPAAIGTGNCSSWANACTLQTALTGAVGGDEIWAATGVYKPTAGTDRTATFQLKTDVGIYGGFAGTETARDQRDRTTNVTVLSGDLDGNDINTDGNFISEMYSDILGTNSYHVVTGSGTGSSAVLDGFTITAGQATGIGDNSDGGGIFNSNGWPTLANLTFSGNLAGHDGGGMANFNCSSLMLTNITFSGNKAGFDGGGMYSTDCAAMQVMDATFRDNIAVNDGGGMKNYASAPLITNVIFRDNTARFGGGLMNGFNELGSPTLTNVVFSGNQAASGGGMFQYYYSSPKLTNIVFMGNQASDNGGGMYNWNNSNPILTNVTFAGNWAGLDGGAIYGGEASIPLLQNVIAWNNASGLPGATIFNYDGTSIPAIRFSLVQGCKPGGLWNNSCGTDGGNNLVDIDPQFIAPEDASSAPTTAGDYRLQDASPAINSGDNAADLDGTGPLTATIGSITTDLDSNPRFVRVRVDLGAYENQTFACPAGGVLYVDHEAVGQQTGVSWSNALTTLQDALQVSESCEVWVAEGVYYPDQGGSQADNDRSATFQLKNSVALYGGFAGTETARSQRNPAVNVTILSGDIDNDDSQAPIITDLTTVNGNTTNSYHVVTGATGATLDGFTITAGNANVTYNEFGGGMFNSSSSPTLTNLTFIGNSANYGGGMCTWTNSPTLTNVTFSGNAATYEGGGVYNGYGSSALTNVTFIGNTAVGIGGGGMFNVYSSPSLTNVTFSVNSANYGGGVYNWCGNPTLTNVTFSGNTAVNSGGGMYNDHSSSPQNHNTIFWGNTAPTGAQVYNDSSTSGTSSVNDSVVQSGCPAGSTCSHIITSDPLLGTLGNYGGLTRTIPLLANSSAINTGKNATCAATDQRGIIRPQGARCDIGAFELVDNSPPNTSIDRQNPTATPTNSTSMTFTFSGTDTVSGVRSFQCDLDGGGFAGCTSPKSYASLADGAHTFQVHAIDFVGNVDASPASRAWTVNTTAPTVNSFTVVTPSNDLNIPITAFSATDDLPVTGYLITTSSTPPAAAAADWTGTAPVTYTVAADGSYNLYPWAQDAAGNVSAVFAAPCAVVVDTTAPIVTIIVRTNPSPTNLGSVNFTVTFSESVSGVAAGDFTLAKTGTISGESVTGVSGGPIIYTVSINTGSSQGTLRLDVTDDDSIQDGAGNPLGGVGAGNGDFMIGQTYTIDKTAPAVSMTSLTSDPTNASPIAVSVTFSESVTGFTSADLVPANGAVSNFKGSGANYTFNLTPGGQGLVSADIAAGVATDLASNNNTIATQFSRVYDTIAPTVSSSLRLDPSPTSLASVNFTVTFSEPVTGVGVTDFSLTTTGVSSASVTGVSVSDNVYTVIVNTGSGNGTIRLDVSDGATITDLAGNPLAGLPYTGGETYTIAKVFTIFLPLILH